MSDDGRSIVGPVSYDAIQPRDDDETPPLGQFLARQWERENRRLMDEHPGLRGMDDPPRVYDLRGELDGPPLTDEEGEPIA